MAPSGPGWLPAVQGLIRWRAPAAGRPRTRRSPSPPPSESISLHVFHYSSRFSHHETVQREAWKSPAQGGRYSGATDRGGCCLNPVEGAGGRSAAVPPSGPSQWPGIECAHTMDTAPFPVSRCWHGRETGGAWVGCSIHGTSLTETNAVFPTPPQTPSSTPASSSPPVAAHPGWPPRSPAPARPAGHPVDVGGIDLLPDGNQGLNGRSKLLDGAMVFRVNSGTIRGRRRSQDTGIEIPRNIFKSGYYLLYINWLHVCLIRRIVFVML